MIGRRGFLRVIGAGVVGMALALRAPEAQKATTITIDEVFGVDFEWSDIEVGLTMEDERAEADRAMIQAWSREWDRRAASAAGVLYVDDEVVTLTERGLRRGRYQIRRPQRWRRG